MINDGRRVDIILLSFNLVYVRRVAPTQNILTILAEYAHLTLFSDPLQKHLHLTITTIFTLLMASFRSNLGPNITTSHTLLI